MADAAETITAAAKKNVETATAQVKASTQQAQAQAEKVQAAGAQAFREGVDKSVASLTELNAHGKKNLEAMVESATAAQKGAEALSQNAFAYGKKTWEDGVAAAQSMAQARSVQELIELQTNWAKSATEAYLAEVTKTTDLFTASMKDSFRPLNERVTASVEKFQAAR
ncbi:MAG TPA: TIGR01841 family phasin [Brevundimonas sp.]|jgi:phasin family protein|uniref:phasin family protein n=1 Tax=Brevundimonas sp. TaxID=1871086 RepID=UPI002DE2382C|nr:TIGR01841 family phasin [Brevundimonas sp.]HEV2080882.1 TIGR01841 family phasin [Brevundimonas sp.]